MSQEYNETSKRSRRAMRAQRNRPVLVTAKDNDADAGASDELSPGGDATSVGVTPTLESATEEIEQSSSTAPAPTVRRFPKFFSSLDKREQASSSEEDIARARLARATRSKQGNQAASTSVEDSTGGEEERPRSPYRIQEKPAQPARSAPPRPTTPFKTRYILGIGIYLLAANFIGVFETEFLRNMHADVLLTQFALFGGQVQVRSSTLLFLATLIIILVLLAKFDLIPRNLGAMMGTPPNSKAGGQSRTSGSNTGGRVRNTPPTVRQGVKGADDVLYQQYRARQRREKKK